MDSLLAEMRGAESNSHDDAWPTQLPNKIEKQVSIYYICA